MKRKWSHGHSTAVGVILGLLLARHGWLVACLAGGTGLLVGRLWYYEAMMAEALSRRVARSRDVTRQRKAAAAKRARSEGIPY